MNPTAATYRTLAEAVDYLNAQLFGGTLPPFLVTLQRSPARSLSPPSRFPGLRL